jgi:hypothetical protein
VSVSPYGRCDWALTNTSEKYVMADNALDAADLLRPGFLGSASLA